MGCGQSPFYVTVSNVFRNLFSTFFVFFPNKLLVESPFPRWDRTFRVFSGFDPKNKKENREKSSFDIFISELMIASANPKRADASIKRKIAEAVFFL